RARARGRRARARLQLRRARHRNPGSAPPRRRRRDRVQGSAHERELARGDLRRAGARKGGRVNVHAIQAIYRFEMARTFRTVTQSIASPVLSTSLYFIVFGSAIGSRMGQVDGVDYGSFIVP